MNVSPQAPTAAELLQRLVASYESMTPELRKAANWVLENPKAISITSVREAADAAGVKPNTLVRMARAINLDGYEDFRRSFRDEVRRGRDDFPERARWLQSLSKGGKLSGLYGQMAAASIGNIETLFAGSDAKAMKAAADEIIKARATYVLGVGIAHGYAVNFAYLASMAVGSVTAIPRVGSVPVDDLVRAGRGDVLLAMTFKPYRREVVEAVTTAESQGVKVIAVSDRPTSPILRLAKHRFIVPTATPQFFTSMVALGSFLETLIAFVVADADADIIANIERFHERRHQLGIYWDEEG